MDEEVDKLLESMLETTTGNDRYLLAKWFACFTDSNTQHARQLRAAEEIKSTLRNKENLRDPQVNFIRKLLMYDQPEGYRMQQGDKLAKCFLDNMRQLPYWTDVTKKLEDDLVEELLHNVSQNDNNNLLLTWLQCFDKHHSEQVPIAERDENRRRGRRNRHTTYIQRYDGRRLQAKDEIKNTLRTGEADFIKKLLLKDKPGGYKIEEGPQLAKNFLKVMKQLPCWKIFAESLEGYFAENLLETADKINKALLMDWLKCLCFHKTAQSIQRRRAEREIKNTITDYEGSQRNPDRNFIMRLVSGGLHGYKDTDGNCKRHFRLAELFMLLMRMNSYCDECVENTVRSSISNDIAGANVIYRASISLVNFEEIKHRYRELSLHEAARLEDEDLVNNLIGDETLHSDEHGCTALHFAAMAINPNALIARKIVQAVKTASRSLNMINQRSDEESGGNTALHIAAGNVNVTQEFIAELKDADPVVFNDEHYSPFHVAAKSKNQNVIIYMLKIFAPTNNCWDIDDVDVAIHQDDNIEKRREDRLINICARNGTAKAVALLIQHGADISKGVLHEIVLESVNNLEKTGKLLEVYQSVVDNAVTWRCLEEKRVSPLKGSSVYSEMLRETMIWLLTKPLAEYQERDVLEYAMSRAASTMFQRIINTVGVFRLAHSSSYEMRGTITRAVKFDVTNFIQETMVKKKPRSAAQQTNAQTAERDQLLQRELSVETDDETQRDFTKRRRPKVPYMTYLLSRYNRWTNSNILSNQPLKQLTKPYFALIQRFYLLVGLMQLLFMALFSWYYTPDTCSLSLMFNINITHCNSNQSQLLLNADDNNITSSNMISQPRTSAVWFWLLWPIILITVSIMDSFYSAAYTGEMYSVHAMGKGNYAFQWTRRMYEAASGFLLESIVLKIFCCMVFLWFYMYHSSENHESYVQVTAMVLLFGWITNLEFFGAINKHFSILVLVVKEIIADDIPSFMMIFMFTLIGFSFAMHGLRMSTCELNYIYFQDTFYGVLSSAFGIGDFFERAFSNPLCVGAGMQHLFEAVYFGYTGITLIILLNVLIAMMNNRYEIAKRRAENLWRFQILCKMRTLDKIFGNVLRKCNIADLWRPGTEGGFWCYFVCCFHDRYNGEVEHEGGEDDHKEDTFYMYYHSRTDDSN